MTLKFKVDESLPAEVAALLAAAGHDALTVPDQQLGGRSEIAFHRRTPIETTADVFVWEAIHGRCRSLMSPFPS